MPFRRRGCLIELVQGRQVAIRRPGILGNKLIVELALPYLPEPLLEHRLGCGIHVRSLTIEDPTVRCARSDAKEVKGLRTQSR
jgi:hypothetical protein